MPVKKKKRKATPAQLRALAKGRRTLAAKRRKNKIVRSPARAGKKRATKKRVTRKKNTHQKARAALRKPANPVKPSSRVTPHYVIKCGGRYFDGAMFTKDRTEAATWKSLKRCKKIASMVANATGKSCSIID